MDHFWLEVVGYVGTTLTIASYSMRTIVPLRVAAILASVFFIWYGLAIGSWPVVISELVILPLNTWRLLQVLRLIRLMDDMARGEPSSEWLVPFGRKQRYDVGDVVFREGDEASYVLVVTGGRFVLREADIGVGPGAVVGEMGFLSPGNKRTMTLVCTEAGEVSRVSYPDLKTLYFTNPKFAFYLLRLISGRLFENLDRAERARILA